MMNLDQLIHHPKDTHIHNLLARSKYWQNLDKEIKKLLPPNLHPHFQVACINQGQLILFASSQMASNRLKMLLPTLLPHIQNLVPNIIGIQCRTRPQPKIESKKQLTLSPAARSAFEQTAHRLQRHPKLAAALKKLAEQHR